MPLNYILLPVSTEIKTAYDTDTEATTGLCSLFSGNNLRLFFAPGDYRQPGTETLVIKDGFGGPVIQTMKRKVVIDLTIRDGRSQILDVIRTLMNTATANPANVTGVTMIDYIQPELADRATGYSTRVGLFEVPEELTGTIREADAVDSRRFDGGFSITFTELAPRGTW